MMKLIIHVRHIYIYIIYISNIYNIIYIIYIIYIYIYIFEVCSMMCKCDVVESQGKSRSKGRALHRALGPLTGGERV